MTKKLFTIKQIATIFGVHEKSVYRWKSEGMPVEVNKPVRILYEDVKKWLNRKEKEEVEI